MTNQLLLFDPEPDAVLPDIRSRLITEAELAIHLRHLQAQFDARAKNLYRCESCKGYVHSVDLKGMCTECRDQPRVEVTPKIKAAQFPERP